MYGLKCVVSIVGQKQKCYFCDDEGHNIAKCPVKETLCEKCHQKGHLTKKCSIAEKLKSREKKKIDYNDFYIDQEETQSIFEAGQKDDDENRFSESDPNEKEFTEKESKKQLVVFENENDNTFESESNSSITECSIQVDQSSNEVGQQTASQNSIEENLE
ncbi:hypothetical protein BpHYR1_045622 [Brachionus plicatilis]|uniref:CCHC-type domain-containing protein n=1 Tax=Brachionus plicatilis TaxID=10195 RepID=A0A3M7PCB1_BRAPC|nr:hypothetical protein BpHYR1_045622 [Brachionus plicatilis]